jgi:hypothetical protein
MREKTMFDEVSSDKNPQDPKVPGLHKEEGEASKEGSEAALGSTNAPDAKAPDNVNGVSDPPQSNDSTQPEPSKGPEPDRADANSHTDAPGGIPISSAPPPLSDIDGEEHGEDKKDARRIARVLRCNHRNLSLKVCVVTTHARRTRVQGFKTREATAI